MTILLFGNINVEMRQIRYIVSLFLILTSFLVHAETKNESWMVTDRDIYVSGETLLSKVYVPQNQEFQMLCLSLSASNGTVVASVKLGIDDHQADGGLYIPDSLSTGSYLLTTYSCHYERQAFFSKEIFVINRFENQDDVLDVNRGGFENIEIGNAENIEINGLSGDYSQREDVTFSLSLDDEFKNNIQGDLSVSVAQFMPDWNSGYLSLNPDFDSSVLLTKEKGTVIQGKVTNKSTGFPEGGATVYLSVPDSIPYFDYYTTRSDGEFFFLLEDFYGSHSTFIQAIKEGETENLQVSIHEILSDEELVYTPEKVELTEEQEKYLYDVLSLITFKKVYDKEEYVYHAKPYRPIYPFPFYGRAEYTVDTDEYIELPDFSEISKELLSPVRFRERNGIYTLNIFDRDSEDFFTRDPLILIDGVPVQSLDKIFSIGSSEIDWIEVVPRMRFYGSQRFHGILSIFTKERDGSMVFSSDRMLKLDYDALQEEIEIVTPQLEEKHSPDFRQVLFWNPDFSVDGEEVITFKTSNIQGTYKVLITGREKDGELVQKVQYFTVSR